MKLVFAAPASFLPSLPTALVSQHFFIELALAAPARALPSLPTALAAQAVPSCARAGEAANSESRAATQRCFIMYLTEIICCQISAILPSREIGGNRGTGAGSWNFNNAAEQFNSTLLMGVTLSKLLRCDGCVAPRSLSGQGRSPSLTFGRSNPCP